MIRFLENFFLLPGFSVTLLDSSSPWQMFFQDSASPVMEGIINLHHDLMFFLTFIFFFVLVVLGRTLYYFQYSSTNDDIQSRSVVHGTLIELI
jgi:cytochrome c oxidase subunit 2